jgi:hypothetical protein
MSNFNPSKPSKPHDDDQAVYNALNKLANAYLTMHAIDHDEGLAKAMGGVGVVDMDVHELVHEYMADLIECASSFDLVGGILKDRQRKRRPGQANVPNGS